METLINIVGSVLASILGTIFAKDIQDSAPRYTRQIIERAAARLPPDLKEEKQEEWLAHLSELDTVTSKYRHALGVYVGAARLRRTAQAMTLALGFQVAGVGPISLNVELGPSLARSILSASLHDRCPRPVRLGVVILFAICMLFKLLFSAETLGRGKSKLLLQEFKNFKSWRVSAKLKTRQSDADLSGIFRKMLHEPTQIKTILMRIADILKQSPPASTENLKQDHKVDG
ncbi:hypothetical protein QA648_36405 (plasmid) [Rhizobium sp. CB3171]|uniref:hypothetical protein n=1 Tax=Rhizobium sp. CB3171 TaxID=3039157 RepID=UPI0024B1DDA4|nr:hypothetical protein [Rhizobium sp. CB3171]WFU07495.1 hypothetical protein QA648_36405 [Rhizobium sp. CB3171]